MNRSLALFAMLASMLVVPAADAAPECRVLVLRAVTDDLGNAWRQGQTPPVDIQRDGPNAGSYCASGGSCLPLEVAGAQAVRLTNCRVGAAIGGGDHRLSLDPGVVPPSVVRKARSQDEVSARLSSLGFSNAAAATLAQDYVEHPHTKTARLVAQALAGSREAATALNRNQP